jgi:hypothetical protein
MVSLTVQHEGEATERRRACCAVHGVDMRVVRGLDREMSDFSSRDLDAGSLAADRQICCASHGRSGLASGRSDVEAWGYPWCVDGLEMLPKVGGQRLCPVRRDLGGFAVVVAGVVW